VLFYTNLLGFEIDQEYGPVTILKRDGLELWMSGPGSSAADAIPEDDPREPGWNRLVLLVDELDARVAELEHAGTRFRGGRQGGPAGRWIVAEDPSGNPVELFEPRRG
jgi:catechol 2,3-dioxygenase-like lactoylglutathione lyase family enzyme